MAEFGWLYEIGELSRQNVYDAVFDWVMDVASAHKIKTKVVVCVCLCVCVLVCVNTASHLANTRAKKIR